MNGHGGCDPIRVHFEGSAKKVRATASFFQWILQASRFFIHCGLKIDRINTISMPSDGVNAKFIVEIPR
jgi:hypothetical protein